MPDLTIPNINLSNKKLEKLLTFETATVKEAMKQMDAGAEKILFVVDEAAKLLGTLTDGDIRRWILREGSLEAHVSNLYHQSPRVVHSHQDVEKVKQMMLTAKIEAVPLISPDKVLLDAFFKTDLFSEKIAHHRQELKVPVLIMAGGKGVRLDPFTRILPKPLIPLGEKPIVEIIMDRFAEYGCKRFFLTVNYKAKMIQSYFENAECNYEVIMLPEDAPTGTAGSLRQAVLTIQTPSFFVTNCDVLIEAEYDDIYDFHEKNGADITIVGSMQHFAVPYGVLSTKAGGLLETITEKPEYDFLVNTGVYVIKRDVFKHIPKNATYDFNELIADVQVSGGKICVYPISEQSWIDIGQWQEYQKAVKKLKL